MTHPLNLKWMRWIAACAYVLLTTLAGCASASDNTPAHLRFGAGPLPGDAQMYSFGVVQDPAYFESHIEHAQRYYGTVPKDRIWSITRAGSAPATMGGLRLYYPLSVRWQLKDGRQFILEDIDIAAIMRDYFKTNTILLQHQREGRERIHGDYNPSLVHEIRDDSLVIKWLLTINKTPMAIRLGPQGVNTKLQLVDEEIPVITLKGNPTSGIDFSKRWETRNFSRPVIVPAPLMTLKRAADV
ncbi:MAG: hypothetical protein AB7P37_19690 [Ramlibacter sp.]